MDSYMESVRGASRISGNPVTSLDDIINKGIDGVYETASPPPKYIIAEAKYGTSKLNLTDDGLQMSDTWIKRSERLEKAVGIDKAEDIKMEMFLNPENVQKVLIHVDANGNVVESILDTAGKKMKN
ncbi:cytosolic protein [Listeria monocytogenes]|nr:cytosolic protein [Listeria monocytogenes]EAG1700481.1 cytosolic protein [Listeria monocytogenes]EBF5839990.1 cytosolic protein [Listeria monocytogenes]EGP4508488.1 cytosolic protein [Listeria monocytogenes]EHD5595184.1 cytosolic protein [Listeria monocytogenes]